MSDLFLLVMQVLRDRAVEGLQVELDDIKRQLDSLLTIRVIKNARWDEIDVPREVRASGVLLPEHAIGVEVPRSELTTIREKFHCWLVPVVGQCKILDLLDCQIEFFGIADDLVLDLWSFELIPDQDDSIRVNLCMCDPHMGRYTTLSYVKCRICGLADSYDEVERMTSRREILDSSGASRWLK